MGSPIFKLSWQCSNITRFCIKHRDNWQTREIHGSEAHSRDQKRNLFVSLERAPDFWCLGTKTLVPGHQNSGAPTSFLLLSYQCTSIHAGNVWRRKKLFLQTLCYAKPCYCAPISTWMNYLYGNCPNAIYWSKCWSTKGPPEPLSNRAGSSSLRRFRTMNFSCLPSVYMCFMQNLVILEHCQHKMSMHWWENPPKKMGAPEFWCPGTRSLVPFQADKQVFCFNFKNGLQNYEFLWFAKCLYVFYAKTGYIGTLPA